LFLIQGKITLPVALILILFFGCRHKEGSEELTMKQKTLFSQVDGILLCDGQPIAGVEIEQRCNWLGVDSFHAISKSDSNGVYHFPAIRSRKSQAAGEKDIFIMQTLIVRLGEEAFDLWRNTKYDYRENGELGGYPLQLRHDLAEASRNYRIPNHSPYQSDIDGIVQLDHPYVHDLEFARNTLLARQDAIASALLDLLNRPELIKHLNSQVQHALLQPAAVAEVAAITQLEVYDFCLFNDADREQISLDRNSHVGFSIRAKLDLVMKNDAPRQFSLSWTEAAITIADLENATLVLAGKWQKIHIDEREVMRRAVDNQLQEEKLRHLLEQHISTLLHSEHAYSFDKRLQLADLIYENRDVPAEYEPAFRVEKIDLSSWRCVYVLTGKGHASVEVRGKLSISDYQEPFSFRVYPCIALTSLENEAYELHLDADCSLRYGIPTFAISLGMVKDVFRTGEAITMRFSVTNLLNKKNIFLRWHTPFEGFANEFLEITHLPSGESIPYEGILASRAAPTRENGSYLEVPAGATKETTIDLREAYTFSSRGRYRVLFSGLDTDIGSAPISTEFELE
jgi:hypothetical protein